VKGIKMINIFLTEISEILESERVFNYKNKFIQKIYGRQVLYYGLKKIYGIRDAQIGYTQYLKPFLENYNNIFFSISHSSNMVVCAIADSEIGIDIQTMLRWDEKKILKIVDYFFNEKEVSLIENSENAREIFWEIWVSIESYIKYKGIGLKLPLDCLDITISDYGIKLQNNEDLKENIYIKLLDSTEKYKMAFCSGKPSEFEIEEVNCDKIIEQLNVYEENLL